MTSRELDVLKLVATGLTNRKTAERLGLSSRTIDAHLRSIYGKIGVASRSAASRYAVEHGLAWESGDQQVVARRGHHL